MFRLTFILLVATIFLSSCGPKLSPLTQRLIEEQDWGDPELQRIQFYLSEDLVLSRELRKGNTRIENGKVKIVNGREVEEVVFKARTPGVFSFSPRTNRIAISFEDSDQKYLVFGPNPKNGNRYSILASDWNKNYGTVTYAGEKWRISSRDAFANLLIPIKAINDQDRKGRVVGGRKVR